MDQQVISTDEAGNMLPNLLEPVDESEMLPSLSPISNTRDLRGENMLVDYLIVSFVGAIAEEVCIYLFGDLFGNFDKMDSSMRGFKHVLSNGLLFIHYDNKGPKDVVVLEIRGRGCRFLEQLPNHSWQVFFQHVVEIPKHVELERCSFKRIDVAIDSFTKETLTPTRALRYLKKNLVTSRFQTGRTIHEYRIKSSELSGESFYLGKRSSDLSILIYDKRFESGTEYCWYRTELRFRNAWAMKVVSVIGNPDSSFPKFVADSLKSNVQFRSSAHKRSELRRQPLAVWYLKYLTYIETQDLYKLKRA